MIHAVGDLHGQIGELERALALIDAMGEAGAPVVFLGDYTDRGPDSRAVIERLIAGPEAGRDWIFLRGNHDRMFLRFLRFLRDGTVADPAIRSGKTWLHPALGGGRTLAAYGVRVPGDEVLSRLGQEPGHDADLARLLDAARDRVPAAHRAFLEGTRMFHEAGDQVFVHAGLRPGVPLDEQVEDDLLWIREPFLFDPRDHGPLVVHGHTAVDAPEHRDNRLNLDSGAGFGRPVTAALIDGRAAWCLTDAGRAPILP
nr:metallophosphoesterase family protein [Jannaschia sp. S6380]